MPFITTSLKLTNKWQKINVAGTTDITISSRNKQGYSQPVMLAISTTELDPDALTEDYVHIGTNADPTRLAGLTDEHVYLKVPGNIETTVGILRNQT